MRHYLISGRVQGVGYRAFCQRQAETLGLNGWVRNLKGGQVEVLASGSEFALKEFREVLEKGSTSAQVSRIEFVELHEPMELSNFEIIEDGEEAWQKESFVRS